MLLSDTQKFSKYNFLIFIKMTTCPEKSPKEGTPAPKVNVAKILQWLHHMYKINNIPIQMNGFSHTMMKNGKALKPPDSK